MKNIKNGINHEITINKCSLKKVCLGKFNCFNLFLEILDANILTLNRGIHYCEINFTYCLEISQVNAEESRELVSYIVVIFSNATIVGNMKTKRTITKT